MKKKKKHIFWDIFENRGDFKGNILDFEVNRDIKEFKNLILKDHFSEIKNKKLLGNNTFEFGNEFNFKYLSHFFQNLGFEFKLMVENNGIFNIFYFLENNNDKMKIKINVECENFFDALKLSEAKLIEKLLPKEIFDNFVKNFISKKNKIKIIEDNNFFDKFKCEIVERILPKHNFLNSEKRIIDLKNFDVKNNDLEDIIFEIGNIYNTEINFEINEFNDLKEILIFTEDNKENGYFFKISCENPNRFLDFAILKFLEIEFKILFKWILSKNFKLEKF